MNTKINSWFYFIHLLVTLKLAIISRALNVSSSSCSNGFNCGSTITGIGYPFRGFSDPPYCGHPNFVLTCDYQKNGITNIDIMGMKYRVLEIEQGTQTMTISREDIMEEACPTEMKNTTLDYSTFDFATIYANITFLYGCPPDVNEVYIPVSCGNMNSGHGVYVAPGTFGPGICRDSVTVPFPVPGEGVTQYPNITELDRVMRQGFMIRWKIDSKMCSDCTALKGRCGYNPEKSQTACYCPDSNMPYASNSCPLSDTNGTPPPPFSKSNGIKLPITLGVVLGVTALTILAIIIVVVCYRKRWRSPRHPNHVSNQDIEKFILQHGSLSLKRYKYSEIKKMTKSFSDKLGRGGYGSVYKGELPDRSFVAVKVLIETDSNGEEFINEVASISRTSHVNIVNLLGFCYDRNKRALVYEYMPNKSLDKFITNNNFFDLEKLYKIAVGVAKGLQYLHTGCNTRIVHFDIKPQNILLDEDLCPKISDFGLAKLCKKKQSILSVSGTRGTIGYIAPEVFSRNFGGASYKSDVYSYGMMILEMAGARKFDEIVTTHQSSENYFPDKIYEQVILNATTKLEHLAIEYGEETLTRKMFLVGFWCIQTNPTDRPSMSKVVEMLEGSLQSIQIPPKPFLFSPMLSDNGNSSFSAYFVADHLVECPV